MTPPPDPHQNRASPARPAATPGSPIVFFHLLDDYSGSPRVLADILELYKDSPTVALLYTGSGSRGPLATASIPLRHFPYRRSPYRLATLAFFAWSQAALLVRIVASKRARNASLFYVNTQLPVAALLAARLLGIPSICHVHEFSAAPGLVGKALAWASASLSTTRIFVSAEHRRLTSMRAKNDQVAYNSMSQSFFATAMSTPYRHHVDGKFQVLMLASLRNYKGIPEFLHIARGFLATPNIIFTLVLNAPQNEVEQLKRENALPNVCFHPATNDTLPFYRNAGLVMNLSRVDQWVETFGLTILEAMAHGIPVVAPPAGGPKDLVRDGVEGFLIDSRNNALLRQRILSLSQDAEIATRMSSNARARAQNFSPDRFRDTISHIIATTSRPGTHANPGR